jgi:hypothetical protein
VGRGVFGVFSPYVEKQVAHDFHLVFVLVDVVVESCDDDLRDDLDETL